MEKTYQLLSTSSRSSDEEVDFLIPQCPVRQKWSPARKGTAAFTAVISILSYTLLVLGLHHYFQEEDLCRSGSRILPNIAQEALEYEEYYFQDNHEPDHPLFGQPSEKLNENWEEFMKWSNIRVPEGEMHRLGREDEGVHFPDGGYLGMYTVYHHLHCLKRIHHHMYVDEYFPALTNEEFILERKHTVHCLDLVKQAVMCHADTTLLTMHWRDDSLLPGENWTSPHSCADWSQVEGWSRDHWVDARVDGMMIHPKYGALFGPNKSNMTVNRIGVANAD